MDTFINRYVTRNNQQPLKRDSDAVCVRFVPVAGKVARNPGGRRAALIASCSAEAVKRSVGKRSLQERTHTCAHSHIQNTQI